MSHLADGKAEAQKDSFGLGPKVGGETSLSFDSALCWFLPLVEHTWELWGEDTR